MALNKSIHLLKENNQMQVERKLSKSPYTTPELKLEEQTEFIEQQVCSLWKEQYLIRSSIIHDSITDRLTLTAWWDHYCTLIEKQSMISEWVNEQRGYTSALAAACKKQRENFAFRLQEQNSAIRKGLTRMPSPPVEAQRECSSPRLQPHPPKKPSGNTRRGQSLSLALEGKHVGEENSAPKKQVKSRAKSCKEDTVETTVDSETTPQCVSGTEIPLIYQHGTTNLDLGATVLVTEHQLKGRTIEATHGTQRPTCKTTYIR